MATLITTTSGISYSNSAGAAGPYFPIKYALPFYDPYLDSYLMSATLYPASACDPVSAVWPRGQAIYNTIPLTATYNYTVTNTKMLVSAAGQTGTTSIIGNPFNAVTYVNLLNGKPLVPTVSGTSLNYSNGTWLVGGYTSIPVSGTLNTVSGYSNIRDIYFPVVSYTPLTCAAGGQAHGLHKVRIGNQYGSFKFNKVALFMTKYDAGGVEDTSIAPVLYNIVAMPNAVIKTNTGDNISYIEVDVETVISASNYFGQISYLTNSEWNTASPGVINYTGKAALGSSAIPGSWEPRARLHLYSEESVDNLRFSNENFDYLSFDMGTVGDGRVSYILDTSASKTIDMRVRGSISATGNIRTSESLYVSGSLYVGSQFSVDPFGVVTCDNIIYTEQLEVYQNSTFGGSITVDETSLFNDSVFVVNNLTATNLSAGETVYSKYTIASEILSGKVLQVTSNSQFEGDMRFIRDITSEISVLITSAGVISGGNIFGNSLNAANGANVGAFLYVGASSNSPSIFYRDVDFYRETTHGGNTRYTHGQTGAHTVLITSAGVVSAGGGNGQIWGDHGFFEEDITVGELYVGGNSYIGAAGTSNEISSDNTFLLGTGGNTGNLNVSGAVANHTTFRNRGHATFESEMRVSGTSVFKEGLSVSGVFHVRGDVNLDGGVLCNRTALVTTTGSPPTAECGSASVGRVMFSGTISTDTDITVNTTAVKTNSVILVTPIRQNNGVGAFAVDTTITDGTSFIVNFNSQGSSYGLDGFYFMIINQST